MELFTEAEAQLDVLRSVLGDSDSTPLSARLATLDDAAVLVVLEASTKLIRLAQGVQLAASGVASRRSERAAGHSGLAQSRGHRGAVSLVQEITGASRAEAARTVRVGESLLLTSVPDAPPAAQGEIDAAPTPPAWHAVIDEAVRLYGLDGDDVMKRGYKIYTALDQNYQSNMQELYAQDGYFPPNSSTGEIVQSASVALDPNTGGIQGLIGRRGEYTFRGFNFAIRVVAKPWK